MSFSTKPRLGFLGIGWIWRARLEALAQADVAEVDALADPARADVSAVKAMPRLVGEGELGHRIYRRAA
jgi:predicted dehydrogenase